MFYYSVDILCTTGIEFLKSKKKHPFKRRESLNKKGWKHDASQKKLDEFLVPKKRKKIEDSRFMMMGCSDSFSYMPPSNTIENIIEPSKVRYRSKRRINKLIGKNMQEGPMTRSRLTSIDDFKSED